MVARSTATLRGQWLGKMLKELREENRLTLKDAAEHLDKKASSLSRFEAGLLTISRSDVERLIDLYGVDGEHQRTALLRLAEEITQTGWWDKYAKDISRTIDYVWLENRSDRIRTFNPLVVNGLAQTSQYAEAILAEWHPEASKQQVERWLSVRMRRQQILTGDDPVAMTMILDEAVLRRPVGSRDVMLGQLRHLTRLSQRPNMQIRIVPFSAGSYPFKACDATLFKLPDPFPEIVCVESAAGTNFLEGEDVTQVSGLYRRLEGKCLSADDSVAFLTAVEEELS
ncbi:helix-turn-helix transcriptional regulator [Nocardiopsis rhodophaea]|uniref:Helix-turn-helix transcriptional regulator n=1 Tax=Nocardiopsis rhodophaea TaxID=280238 RepID=A0ABN2SHQ9_9ACTN